MSMTIISRIRYVPVSMTSPGSRVIPSDREAMMAGMLKIILPRLVCVCTYTEYIECTVITCVMLYICICMQ